MKNVKTFINKFIRFLRVKYLAVNLLEWESVSSDTYLPIN